MDSMIVHGCDAPLLADVAFSTERDESDQYLNMAGLTLPFGAWMADPRLNLSIQITRQAISLHPIQVQRHDNGHGSEGVSSDNKHDERDNGLNGLPEFG